MHTACVWSVKLPFAEYSVVKDPKAFSVRRRLSAKPSLSADSGRLKAESQTGGEYRARTGDLLVANQALSQLS